MNALTVYDPSIDRPYQLPRPKYALWQDVGQKLGPMAQATVFVALTDRHHQIFRGILADWQLEIIKDLAKTRGVLLQFPK